jgi:glycosyltransferase involved in cell wall biosynthesis
MLDFEAFKEEYQKVPVEEYPNQVVETMPEPMVSVHVSTYQHADFIHDCLEGVLMQETDFPVEIIIGEDESDDGTREICKEYADRYPEKIRLFLHRRENNIAIHGRPTGRFQFAYSHFVARGKYIAICEGDDYWTDPQKLKKQVDFLESNPNYALSHHDAYTVDAEGKIKERSWLPEASKCRHFSRELMKGPHLITLSFCFRNSFDYYPPSYFRVFNADLFLTSLLGQTGRAKYQSDIDPAAYRRHEDGMWSLQEDFFKVRAHINTFKALESLYKAHSFSRVRQHFDHRYSSELKKLYRMSVNHGMYYRAIQALFDVLSHHYFQGQYKRMLGFLSQSLRFFAGRLRKSIGMLKWK